MKEVEIKFRVKNFRGISKKLKRKGANLYWSGSEENHFFDTPNAKLKMMDASLRLRRWAGDCDNLTLKLPARKEHKRLKIKEEREVSVGDLRKTARILEGLGFQECFRYRKHRQHWKLQEGGSVELDILYGYKFVEIESSPRKINELVQYLDLDWGSATKKSYLALARELKRKK